MRVKKNLGLCGLLLFFSAYYSGSAYAIADLKCGRIGKYVLEIPERFVLAWHERKDEALPDKWSPKEGRRCNVNILKLTMAMTWPGKELVDNVGYVKEGEKYEVVEFSLTRWTSVSGDLRPVVKKFLEAAIKKNEKPVSYLGVLDMFFVEDVDRNNPVTASVYYWQEREGEVSAMFECLWSIKHENLYMCRGNFAVVEAGVLVDLQFSADKLWEWEKVVGATKEHILSKVK